MIKSYLGSKGEIQQIMQQLPLEFTMQERAFFTATRDTPFLGMV